MGGSQRTIQLIDYQFEVLSAGVEIKSLAQHIGGVEADGRERACLIFSLIDMAGFGGHTGMRGDVGIVDADGGGHFELLAVYERVFIADAEAA